MWITAADRVAEIHHIGRISEEDKGDFQRFVVFLTAGRRLGLQWCGAAFGVGAAVVVPAHAITTALESMKLASGRDVLCELAMIPPLTRIHAQETWVPGKVYHGR